jgi:hypothetical protein
MTARREAIRALAPRLLTAAGELTPNEAEAAALVEEILALAERQDAEAAPLAGLQASMFRLLRQRFHAVQRRSDLLNPARARRRLRLEAGLA